MAFARISSFFLFAFVHSTAAAVSTAGCDICQHFPDVPEPNFCLEVCFPAALRSSSSTHPPTTSVAQATTSLTDCQARCRGFPNVPEPNYCIEVCFRTSKTPSPPAQRPTPVIPSSTSLTECQRRCGGWPDVADGNWCIGACFKPHASSLHPVSPASLSHPSQGPNKHKLSTPSHPATVSSVSGFSTLRASNTAWSTNTVVTTASPGSTKQTVVPVIVLAAGVGILLFGLPAAEVGVPFALPGITSPFEIAPNGEPVNEPNNNKPTDKPTPTKDHSSPPPSKSPISTTFSSKVSSRSMSITSSSPSPTSSNTGDVCAAFYASENDESDDVSGSDDAEPPPKFRRGIAGRVAIQKRQLNSKSPIKQLGSCVLTSTVTVPAYWNAAALSGQSGNAQSWYIPITPDPMATLKVAPTYKVVDKAALATSGPGGSAIALGGNVKTNGRVNVDHVYEVSIMKEFFAAQLSTATQCLDFQSVFDKITSNTDPLYARKTRLQSVYQQLPGLNFGGLAGMDDDLNSMKGCLFGQLPGYKRKKGYVCQAMKNLFDGAIAMDLMHNAEIQKLFVEANTRIYEAFLGIDAAIAATCPPASTKPGTPLPQPTWANTYKTWMTAYIAGKESAAKAWAVSMSMSIAATISGTPQPTGFANERAEFDAYRSSSYVLPAHWSFNLGLTWASTSPIQMRDLQARAACAIPSSSIVKPSISIPPSIVAPPVTSLAVVKSSSAPPVVIPPVSSPPPAGPVDCKTCEIQCVGPTAGCVAACLLDPPGPNDKCKQCVIDSAAPAVCVECEPRCRSSKENGGIDCTAANIFTVCNGIYNPAMGINEGQGLCTLIGYARNQSFADPSQSTCDSSRGLYCDIGVGGTPNCLPGPPPIQPLLANGYATQQAP